MVKVLQNFISPPKGPMRNEVFLGCLRAPARHLGQMLGLKGSHGPVRAFWSDVRMEIDLKYDRQHITERV